MTDGQIQDYRPQYSVTVDTEGRMDMSSLQSERKAQSERRHIASVEPLASLFNN